MLLRIILFLAIAALGACEQSSWPPGTIAVVNGEPVSLQSLQSLLDSRSVALGIPRAPSLAEMKEKYRHALCILIAHTLVRQDLANRGIVLQERDIEDAIGQIKDDFGAENLQEYFAEAFLREEEWRQLMRDQLAVNLFVDRVLAPSIKVPLVEIKNYYAEHKQAFALPNHMRICYATADERRQIEAWCAVRDATELENSPLAQCMDTSMVEIPEPWLAEVKRLKPGECGKIIEQDRQWRTLGLVERGESGEKHLSEVYGLVEALLLEEKKVKAFGEWLEHKMGDSKILVNPELFPSKNK